MTIEQACGQVVPKPWGRIDLRPWNAYHVDGAPIGEVWFQGVDATRPDSALHFKLLFTSEPLSIQVHPTDAFAHSIGLAHGKSEAWYVLSAVLDAKVALGLKRRVSAVQLRAAIDEGSISDMIQWRIVRSGDVIFVPAGTIHTIGAGLVVAEIQQRSDATFRLFDYGRRRELHPDIAVAAASAAPAEYQPPAHRLSAERIVLVASPPFVLERFDFPAGSSWELLAAAETWLFVLEGRAVVGSIEAGISEVVFLEAECTHIEVGGDGLKGLMAYVGPEPIPSLLRRLDRQATGASMALAVERARA